MNVSPGCLAYGLIFFVFSLAIGSIAQDTMGGLIVAVICLWVIALVVG